MLFIHLPLLAIVLGAIWITCSDCDEIHSLAATIAGLIALIWVFMLSPLFIQLLITCAVLVIYQIIHMRLHKP